jgi:hypothetical protein
VGRHWETGFTDAPMAHKDRMGFNGHTCPLVAVDLGTIICGPRLKLRYPPPLQSQLRILPPAAHNIWSWGIYDFSRSISNAAHVANVLICNEVCHVCAAPLLASRWPTYPRHLQERHFSLQTFTAQCSGSQPSKGSGKRVKSG